MEARRRVGMYADVEAWRRAGMDIDGGLETCMLGSVEA